MDQKKCAFGASHRQEQKVDTHDGKEGRFDSKTGSLGEANDYSRERLFEWG